MRSFAPVLLALLALPGCALFQREPSDPPARQVQPSAPYSITVRPLGPATVTDDGFEARFDFHITSPFDLRRTSMVQELQQTMTITYLDGRVRTRELSLVEAFQMRLLSIQADGTHHYGLMRGQRDRHAMAGLAGFGSDVEKIRIQRRVYAYVANVAGADFSAYGFAHLPLNEDGTVVSRVGKGFNAHHQENHETRGQVWQSATAYGVVYRMEYDLRRGSAGMPTFFVDYGGGMGVVVAPEVIYAASR